MANYSEARLLKALTALEQSKSAGVRYVGNLPPEERAKLKSAVQTGEAAGERLAARVLKFGDPYEVGHRRYGFRPLNDPTGEIYHRLAEGELAGARLAARRLDYEPVEITLRRIF